MIVDIDNFLVKLLTRIRFEDSGIFLPDEPSVSYRVLLKEYTNLANENKILSQRNEELMQLLEKWLIEYGNIPDRQQRFIRHSDQAVIARALRRKEIKEHNIIT